MKIIIDTNHIFSSFLKKDSIVLDIIQNEKSKNY